MSASIEASRVKSTKRAPIASALLLEILRQVEGQTVATDVLSTRLSERAGTGEPMPGGDLAKVIERLRPRCREQGKTIVRDGNGFRLCSIDEAPPAPIRRKRPKPRKVPMVRPEAPPCLGLARFYPGAKPRAGR